MYFCKMQNMQIIFPILPLLGQGEKCYCCGEEASHIGIDGTYTCAKEICILPLLHGLRTKLNYLFLLSCVSLSQE